MKSKIKLLAFGNLAGFILTIIVNYMAVLLPLNGKTTGELSDANPNLFVPAGLTFSIWGIIYLLLAFFSVYQLIMVLKGDITTTAIVEKIGPFFILSSLVNSGWIFAWHFEIIPLSLLLMLGILGSLITIYLKLRNQEALQKGIKRLALLTPFSVYLGWITIATIANVTVQLTTLGWDGFGLPPWLWAAFMIGAGTIITLLFLFTQKDYAYGLVVLWAFLGIILKRTAESPVYNSIIGTAAGGMVLIAAMGLYVVIKRYGKKSSV